MRYIRSIKEYKNLEIGGLPVIKEGQVLWSDLDNLPRIARRKVARIKVKVPTRLNFGILDFTEMRPNLPGTHCNSGSLGFGVGLYSTVSLKLINRPQIIIENISREKRKLLTHVALVMKKLTDYSGGFEIAPESIPYPHVGLGSTASLTCALYNAINIAFGSPFTDRELVKIGAFNYVEEGPKDKLYPGQSTGLSGWVAIKGGICVVTAEAELVIREVIPKNYKVVVGLPVIEEKGVAESSKELPDLKKFYFYDRFNSGRICHWVLMKLIPALRSKNFKEVGEITWDMFFNSCKGVGAIMLRESSEILEILFELRKVGGEICFISSVGPAMATLIPLELAEKAVGVFKKHNLNVLKLDPDNQGRQILL